MTYHSNDIQRRNLFVGPVPYGGPGERAVLLRKIWYMRATLAWITPYCYGWFVHKGALDDLRWKLIELRRVRQSN